MRTRAPAAAAVWAFVLLSSSGCWCYPEQSRWYGMHDTMQDVIALCQKSGEAGPPAAWLQDIFRAPDFVGTWDQFLGALADEDIRRSVVQQRPVSLRPESRAAVRRLLRESSRFELPPEPDRLKETVWVYDASRRFAHPASPGGDIPPYYESAVYCVRDGRVSSGWPIWHRGHLLGPNANP